MEQLMLQSTGAMKKTLVIENRLLVPGQHVPSGFFVERTHPDTPTVAAVNLESCVLQKPWWNEQMSLKDLWKAAPKDTLHLGEAAFVSLFDDRNNLPNVYIPTSWSDYFFLFTGSVLSDGKGKRFFLGAYHQKRFGRVDPHYREWIVYTQELGLPVPKEARVIVYAGNVTRKQYL
jgi:hypothetical protein